LATHLLV
jgi:hypothetical protein